MSAVDRQDAKLVRAIFIFSFIAHINAGECSNAVPRLPERIVEIDATCLVERKLSDRPEVDPKDRPFSQPEKISNHGDTQNDGGDRAEDGRKPTQKRSTALLWSALRNYLLRSNVHNSCV